MSLEYFLRNKSEQVNRENEQNSNSEQVNRENEQTSYDSYQKYKIAQLKEKLRSYNILKGQVRAIIDGVSECSKSLGNIIQCLNNGIYFEDFSVTYNLEGYASRLDKEILSLDSVLAVISGKITEITNEITLLERGCSNGMYKV